MRKLYLFSFPILFLGSLFGAFLGAFLGITEARAQSHNLAQLWEVVPQKGQGPAFEAALKQHVAWRNAHGETWNWNIYQVVVGSNFGNFYVRSGDHTWADFDSYSLPGADEHFQETVSPLLESISNVIMASDTVNVYMRTDGDFNLLQIARYDVIPAKQQEVNAAIGKFSEAIRKQKNKMYHAFSSPAVGGNGEWEITGVFPAENWASFEEPDPSFIELMMSEYGEEEAMEILNSFMSGVKKVASSVLVYRKDLSSEYIE